MQKTKHIFLCIITGFLVLLLSLRAPTGNAAVAWSDDFDDGNYDGWTVGDGSFSVADNCLEATGADWSAIEHASTVAYGNWSFWFYSNDSISSGSNTLRIHLMADEILSQSGTIDIPMTNGYAIKIDPDWFGIEIGYKVYRYVNGEEREIVPTWDNMPDSVVYGWFHIEITRDTSGTFNCYGNDTLTFHFTDTTHTSSNLFGFASDQGQAFDNVVISEPDQTSSFPWELLLIGVGVVGVIVIIGFLFYRRRTP